MEFRCKYCDKTDSEAEFYVSLANRCKECHKQKVRENRAANADYYRTYDAKRFKNDPKVKARHRRYQKTDAGKKSMGASRAKWLKENPDKRAAHVILCSAVRDGRKFKPDKCDVCGQEHHRIHGHHADYTKPLDVVWCCHQCHHDIHEAMKVQCAVEIIISV